MHKKRQRNRLNKLCNTHSLLGWTCAYKLHQILPIPHGRLFRIEQGVARDNLNNLEDVKPPMRKRRIKQQIKLE
jgi:hypothetical protein